MKKFLENYWFAIIMTLLGIAMFSAIFAASDQTMKDKRSCIERGMVYATVSGAGSYCVYPDALEKI